MARRRRISPKFKPIRRVGWYYPGKNGVFYPKGLFCPRCGTGLYIKGGIHPRLLCFTCGWAEGEKTPNFLRGE